VVLLQKVEMLKTLVACLLQEFFTSEVFAKAAPRTCTFVGI
jgi:hypothetical protein